jgi:tetratricopeptide (TPR) repeat protein
MNNSPSSVLNAPGDFVPSAQFSVDTMENFLPVASMSLSVIQKTAGVNTGWVPTPNHESRLSKSVFSKMIEQAQIDVDRLPGKVNPLANLALAHLAGGDRKSASPVFEQVLRIHPQNYLALINLVKIRIQEANYEAAQELCATGASYFPNDPYLAISRSIVEANQGNLVGARKILEKAIGDNPKETGLRYASGVLYIAQGEFRNALGELRQVSRKMERAPQIHQALGVAYALLGQSKEAVKAFRRAISLDKATTNAVLGLAQVLSGLEDFEHSARLLIAFVETETFQNERANDLLAHAFLKLNRESEAKDILVRQLAFVRDTRPSDTWKIAQLLNDIGWCYRAKGNLRESDQHFRQAIAIREDRGYLPFVNLAVQLHRQKDEIESTSLLRRAITLFPNESKLYQVLAGIEEANGNQHEALRLGQRVLNLPNPPADAYAYVGWLLSDWFGELDNAEHVLEQGWKRFPKDKLVGNNLAYVSLLKGDVERAIEILGHFQTGASDIYLTATNGLLALKKGNEEKARELYSLASQLAASGGDALLARSVKQKMHLEFARYYFDNGRMQDARDELRLGVHIQNGRKAYERDLKLLESALL